MLLVRLLVISRLLSFGASQKLYADFQLYRGLASNPHIVQASTVLTFHIEALVLSLQCDRPGASPKRNHDGECTAAPSELDISRGFFAGQ